MNIFEAIASFSDKQFTNFGMSNNWQGSVKDFGALTAIYFNQVIASDTWKVSHNVICKLPPLVAPAFTRIKGVINTFYCSYASVWKYWNSFISDKPEDNYLNRTLLNAYKGRFVEPCVSSSMICIISKIAYGNFTVKNDMSSEDDRQKLTLEFYVTDTQQSYINVGYKSSLSWSLDSFGMRKCTVTVHEDSSHYFDSKSIYYSDLLPSFYEIAHYDGYNTTGITRSVLENSYYSLGYSDNISYLVGCCQKVVRNLEAHGVPCNLMAHNPIDFYEYKLFNLLPFIAESSIWENFYRDNQNQSPEFDYSEVNGHLYNLEDTTALNMGLLGTTVTGWQIRMDNFPLNTQSTPVFYNVATIMDAFILLTGFYLRPYTIHKLNLNGNANSLLFPSHYNALLTLKYRNFEKDYFTSACVDPMQGVAQVQTPSTIEALRTASKLEEFLERSASARDFYNFMKYNFGTSPESTRYKKPLLLGTKIIPIQIGEQLQTSESSQTSPLGERAGVADGYGNGGTCDHYFNEHGIIVSYLSFVVDGQYMQGLNHIFQHHNQLDYPFPDFANLGAESISKDEIFFGHNVYGSPLLGEQSGDILQSSRITSSGSEPLTFSENSPSRDFTVSDAPQKNNYEVLKTFTKANIGRRSISSDGLAYNASYLGEILLSNYSTGSNLTLRSVFGYVPRYSKWKWTPDVVCGQLRTDLEFWNTFRKFNQAPEISHSFVSYEDAGYISDLNRIFAVQNDNADKFVLDIFNNCSVRRCLPLVPNPKID